MPMKVSLLNALNLFMQKLIMYVGFSLILISCGTSEDSRYRDTALLERPPTLVIPKRSEVPSEVDESSIPKKQEPGLGEQVYLTTSTPPKLIIRKPFDKAWNNLLQAVKQNEIKITDQERNKGHLYVGYDGAGFFDKVAKFIKDGHKTTVYQLFIEENGAETAITASMASKTEQSTSSANPDGYNEKPADESQILLETLFKTIHDDLVED
jgi:uncharacterized lipoprotein